MVTRPCRRLVRGALWGLLRLRRGPELGTGKGVAGGTRVSGTRHETRDIPPRVCQPHGGRGKAPGPGGLTQQGAAGSPSGPPPPTHPGSRGEPSPQQSMTASLVCLQAIRVERGTVGCPNPQMFWPVSEGVLDRPECPVVVTNPSGFAKRSKDAGGCLLLRKQGKVPLGTRKGAA